MFDADTGDTVEYLLGIFAWHLLRCSQHMPREKVNAANVHHVRAALELMLQLRNYLPRVSFTDDFIQAAKRALDEFEAKQGAGRCGGSPARH